MDEARHHRPQLVTSHHGHAKVHRGLNRWLAVAITRRVGTMWCAYFFALLALVSFPQALNAFLTGDTLVGVTWLSQSFLQLVLLPVIIVGQNVISAAQDARAEADHRTLSALHHLNVTQLQILEALHGREGDDQSQSEAAAGR